MISIRVAERNDRAAALIYGLLVCGVLDLAEEPLPESASAEQSSEQRVRTCFT